MSSSPKMLAIRDQLQAAIRDRFDRNKVSIHNNHDRMTILTVVALIADSALAWKGHPDDSPEHRVQSISYALEAIVALLEDTE